MPSPEEIRQNLVDEITLGDGWDSQLVRGTAGKIAELYLREDGHDVATIEVISDDARTVVEVSHADYPNWRNLNHEHIPGHVDHITFNSFEAALPTVETLTDKTALKEIIDLVLSDKTSSPNPLKEAVQMVQE